MRPEVIAFIALLVAYFVGSNLLRRYYEMKVEAFFATGLYDEAFSTLEGLLPRILFTTYAQYRWRFLIHEARGEREMATRMIELMLRMRNSKQRQAQTDVMAFNYFVKIGRKKRAGELLSDIKRSCGEAQARDCQLTYDIVFERSHDFIDQMEGMLTDAAPALRAKLYFLLSKQYANAGNAEESRRYKGLMKELDARRAEA